MSLKEIRRAAGYRSAKDFAAALGIPASSYARHEQKPSQIPIEKAWLMADELDCSIDEVVGREWAFERPAWPQQERYDALSKMGQAMFDDYLEFLEFRDCMREAR